MQVPIHIKATTVALSVVSVFCLPWAITVAMMALAGLMLPPAALCIGVLADILYYPGHGWPWGITMGILVTAGATLVRYIVKTRIM